jgi:hypothetical protein
MRFVNVRRAAGLEPALDVQNEPVGQRFDQGTSSGEEPR